MHGNFASSIGLPDPIPCLCTPSPPGPRLQRQNPDPCPSALLYLLWTRGEDATMAGSAAGNGRGRRFDKNDGACKVLCCSPWCCYCCLSQEDR